MTSSFQTRLWRILATSMVLGAAGLGAYYFLLHRTLETGRALTQQNTARLQEQISAEEQRELQPALLPGQRVAKACEDFREAVGHFAESADANANLFAVQELARRAELGDYSVQSAEGTAQAGADRHRIALELDGESSAIDRLLRNVDKYQKAGPLATFELTRQSAPDDEPARGKRAKRPAPANFHARAELHAYAVPSQSTLATDRCNALAP